MTVPTALAELERIEEHRFLVHTHVTGHGPCAQARSTAVHNRGNLVAPTGVGVVSWFESSWEALDFPAPSASAEAPLTSSEALAKNWTTYELVGLVAREMQGRAAGLARRNDGPRDVELQPVPG